jgi:hypothetical protein
MLVTVPETAAMNFITAAPETRPDAIGYRRGLFIRFKPFGADLVFFRSGDF